MNAMEQQRLTVWNKVRSRLKAGSKTFKRVGTFFLALAVLCAGIAMFFAVQNKLTGRGASIAGHRVYTVLSGSMEPALHVGALVFVQPVDAKALKVGDILTFRLEDGKDTVTHRIAEIIPGDPPSFMTKGDANNVEDLTAVAADQIVGRAGLTIPYLGYFVNFAQTKTGLLTLVIVPGVLIIIWETIKIIKYVLAMDREKQRKLLEQQQKKAADEGRDGLE